VEIKVLWHQKDQRVSKVLKEPRVIKDLKETHLLVIQVLRDREVMLVEQEILHKDLRGVQVTQHREVQEIKVLQDLEVIRDR
jgi:hypothetical protein